MNTEQQTERYWELQSKQIFGNLSEEELREMQELDELFIRKTLWSGTKSNFISDEELTQSDY